MEVYMIKFKDMEDDKVYRTINHDEVIGSVSFKKIDGLLFDVSKNNFSNFYTPIEISKLNFVEYNEPIDFIDAYMDVLNSPPDSVVYKSVGQENVTMRKNIIGSVVVINRNHFITQLNCRWQKVVE
jgi:hypothetical protein